jgi:hypothetical protein
MADRVRVFRFALSIAGIVILIVGFNLLIRGGGLGDRTSPIIPDECECSPAAPPMDAADYEIVPHDELATDVQLRSHFSPGALRTANACGLVPLLRRYCRESDPSRRVALRQEVSNRLAVVWLEVSSTAGELDCEEERADQIADYLLGVASARKTNLTLWSIIIGALGTVVTSVIALCGASQKVYRTLGILFGLAVALVSIAALRSDQVVVQFTHQRNALAELRDQPAQRKVLPASVWNYLTWPDSRCGEQRSLRDRLLDRWERSGGLGAKAPGERQRLMALLFSPGGMYRASELAIRGTLFDQLESYVNLMKHDVLQLVREFTEMSRDG